ncbi:hypothetical protein SY88_15785 [Clostridiales bacterium PH28_bin88]|nr:hypothetical protein SY88_15785 [Clostridiales bacterium PH28_bin88]
MELEKVKVDVQGPVAWLVLNEPETLNALSVQVRNDLDRALDLVTREPGIRVAVIKGAGRAFCAGGDLRAMGQENVDVAHWRNRILTGINVIIQKIVGMEKPVLAAVHGFAVGAGCCLAMACDLIIAEESARFGVSFNRVGLIPDGGGTFFLPRLVGLPKAKELVFTGRVITAGEAERIGLVNRVVPDGQLAGEAEKLALEIAAGPAAALGMAKKLLNQGAVSDLAGALEREAFAQSHCMALPDHKEGVAAFFAKRPPRFGAGK